MSARSDRRTARRSRLRRSALTFFVGLVTLLLFASDALAQAKTFTLDRLRIGGAPDDGVALWRPEMGAETRLFGQLELGYSYDPFRIEQHIQDPHQAAVMASVSGPPVRQQFNGYADIGVEVLNRFSFQIMFPFTLAQTGNPTDSPSVPAAQEAVNLAPAAAGDTRFEVRGIIYRTPDRKFKLAADAFLNAPSGNEYSFTGDKSTSGGLGVSTELDFKKVAFPLNLGFNFRPETALNDFQVRNELTFGVGGFMPFRDGRLRLGLEFFGSTGIGGNTTFHHVNTPFEWMAEARYALDKKKRFYLGANAGTRLTRGYAPDFRVGGLIGYWFNVKDVDIESPPPKFTTAEDAGIDFDHFVAPELPDFDKDGIPDARDACPKEPGVADPDPKKNGCPKFIRRLTGSDEIQILQQVQFEFGKAVIKPESYPILDEVWKLLEANPEITLLSIEGHTDNVGGDALNMHLSKERAHSCLDYLVGKGIKKDRLTSDGFGKTKPIDTNDTPEGRAKNRRVEFHIKKQTGGAPDETDGASQSPKAPPNTEVPENLKPKPR